MPVMRMTRPPSPQDTHLMPEPPSTPPSMPPTPHPKPLLTNKALKGLIISSNFFTKHKIKILDPKNANKIKIDLKKVCDLCE